VDRYFGGAEHTTLHLLYSRFWHKFLFDQGLVPTPEPYAWRINGGLLLGPDGKKMSKSKGNVIEPMELVDNFGADALRMFICFLGPYEDTYPWNENGMKATSRLVSTIYAQKIRLKIT
jgi:leucyl-tRNA synthetase